MRLKLEHSPYKHFLDEDENFTAWLENVERGAVTTASEYIRRVGFVCKTFHLSPAQLAEMDDKAAGSFLLKVVSYFESGGSVGTNIKGYVRGLKSWWAFNDISVKKKINIRGGNDNTKYEKEVPPSPKELARVLDVANLRAKVAISIVAFAGTRPEVLGDYLGLDGLTIEDIPDLTLEYGPARNVSTDSNNFQLVSNSSANGTSALLQSIVVPSNCSQVTSVSFARTPALIRVRKNLSKARHEYITFIPAQACQYIKEYLEYRIQSGEKLTPHSPIFTADRFNPQKVGKFIRTTNVSDTIRKAIREASFTWRPYIFRRYFTTYMMYAENYKMFIRDWRVFWTGHKGDIEHVYTLNKGMPHDLKDKMRECYRLGSEKYLVTTHSRDEVMTEEQILSVVNLQNLRAVGYTDEEIENKIGKAKLPKLSNEELRELIRLKIREDLGLKGGGSQKIIPFDDLEKYVEQGWNYIRDLPNNKALVSLPSTK